MKSCRVAVAIAVASLFWPPCCATTAGEVPHQAHTTSAAAGVELALRRPALPLGGAGGDHPIDCFLEPYFARQSLAGNVVVADRVFARRVHLDLVGLLPTPAQLAAFESDTATDKRERLVRTLLDRRRDYAEHWLTFWNDILRNAYRGPGFIDGGRQQITGWLYRALHDNMPYDQFVRELITAADGAEGFTKGLIWRGVVNASQRPEMQAAQNLSQVFLATNLKCASCHDSLINHWKLRDAYAVASVFAAEPLELHHCDVPTGEIAKAGFIYPEFTTFDESLPREARMRHLADLMTRPDQGRLARTIVNRLWGVFFGRGIVEPLDDLDADPFDRDLLDWLAADLIDHKWDLKHCMELICTSQAYQLESVDAAPPLAEEGPPAFQGPLVRRLSAEQFCDAVATLTQAWPAPEGQMVNLDARQQGGQWAVARAIDPAATPPFPAQWIWSHATAAQKAPLGQAAFRTTVDLTEPPTFAPLVAMSDQPFVLYVNEVRALRGAGGQHPAAIDIAPWLKSGANVLAVVAVNGGGLEPSLDFSRQSKNPIELVFRRMAADPAGLILSVTLFRDNRELGAVHTGAAWQWSRTPPAGWQEADFDASKWKPAAVLGDADAEPWRRGRALRISRNSALGVIGSEQVRAALCEENALIRALGRPGREQVVTRRDNVANMLMTLELASGTLLHEQLRQGAEQWLARRWTRNEDLVREMYLTGLGREPLSAEVEVAEEILTDVPSANAVQDLLWTFIMLPEFQQIY